MAVKKEKDTIMKSKPRPSGNKKLQKKPRVAECPETLVCDFCHKRLDSSEFYDSDSDFYMAIGKIPYCKDCVDELFRIQYEKYVKMGYDFPDRRAMERLSMAFDLYYSDSVFDSAAKVMSDTTSTTVARAFFRMQQMYQNKIKDGYDTTIRENYNASQKMPSNNGVVTNVVEAKEEKYRHIKEATSLFGEGFSQKDYTYLYEQYMDWTARHECDTKAKEEVFKQICLTQLELHKAHVNGKDTKDLTATLQKLMETGKIQPKQNSAEAISDAQTFGTLIDKYENTKPLPEIDEELKDVDKIGLYLDVFVRGHLAKTLNLKNAFSNLYDKFMKKYTVTKPVYEEDENDEELFESIFGKSIYEEDGAS